MYYKALDLLFLFKMCRHLSRSPYRCNLCSFTTMQIILSPIKEAVNGKRKAVATARIEMSQHSPSDEAHPVMKQICIKFKSLTNKLKSATLSVSLKGEFLKEGAAT